MCRGQTIAWLKTFALERMLRHRRMPFAYSESADVVRAALGSVLRQRREAVHRTLTEVAGEAGLSPAHLSEVERGRKEVSTERLLAVAHALGVRPADLYAELARLLGADSERPAWPEDPPTRLRLATAGMPLEALRSVADFSAYLAMANPPPKARPRIGFQHRR
ncbi:MAG TPA: hypothetical protein DCK96_13735 [Chloroflexi bacterium]|nr:hypothetical protein [Chloroflexota bacterium]